MDSHLIFFARLASVPMTRAMKWTFLYHAVWNRVSNRSRFICRVFSVRFRFLVCNARYLSSSMSNSEGTEFWERSHTFRSIHVHHAVDQILRYFAEWVVRLILPQVGFNPSRFGCVLNGWINLLTTFLRVWSSSSTVECGSPWIRYSI